MTTDLSDAAKPDHLTDALRRHMEADLRGADLTAGTMVDTDLTGADLTGCLVYGISAWGLKLSEETRQQNLVITKPKDPQVTADSIEVAQFVYLMLHNQKIRDAIDTIGKKGVLLLGRFTGGRIAVLERLREELRKRDFVPMVFNFDSRTRRTSPRQSECSPAFPAS